MRIIQIPIRLSEDQTGNTVTGPGAVLTCYLKDNAKGRPGVRRRAVVICPGGGYEFCSDREAEPVAMEFLAMGCQAFVLNYSTAPNTFPTALMELAAAVSMIRDKATDWLVDAGKIAVCGFSAGGHLAACLGVFWNRDFLLKPLGLFGEQVRPDGLILAYPVITAGEFAHQGSFINLLGRQVFGTENYSGENYGGESRKMTGGEMEGSPVSDITQVCKNVYTRELLSLENRVGPQVPPVFMWHTCTDDTVPVENTFLFAGALRRAGVDLELHIFPEGRHGLALANEETSKDLEDGRGTYVVPCCQSWISLVRVWLKRLDFPNIS